MGNYIMDSFTTEIGGEIRGAVVDPQSRQPSFYGKVGYDSQFQDDLRVRLTGSVYTTSEPNNNTPYGGDRAGARFYSIFDESVAAQASPIPASIQASVMR